MNNQSLWILFVVLIVLDLLVSSIRALMLHARLPNLVSMQPQRPSEVDRTLELLKKPYLLASLRLMVALLHFLIAGLFWFLLPGELHSTTFLWTLFLISIIILGFEFTIERFLLQNVELWAVRLSPIISFVEILLRPVSLLVRAVLGSPVVLQRSLGSVTDDELRSWVNDAQPEGSLEREEREMIYSIIQFSDTLCREIMIPRMDVFALEVETPLPDVIKSVYHSGHSRIPVYQDAIDNILGLLYVKDLLKVNLEEGSPHSIRDLLRPASFVPEAKKVDELLREMQSQSVHMVIVVDEYGGMAGIVTLEDIVEEIVGEIRDEYDQSEELPFQQIGPDEYIFPGRIDLDDFNDLVGTHLTKEVADTLGGYIYGKIGRVPIEGESINVEGWQISVEQVAGRRIRQVRVKLERIPDREENTIDP